MKTPIYQYDSELHGRVLGVFIVAMLVITVIAWFIDGLYGKDWHRQFIEYFDSFWPKAADQARLIGSINQIPEFVGPCLLAQTTFTVLMLVVTVWFIVESLGYSVWNCIRGQWF